MAWTPEDAQNVTAASTGAWVPTDAVWTPDDAVEKRNTTYTEDFGIGLGNAASTVVKGVGLLAGGAASLFNTDVGDAIFKGTGEIAKDTTDYWTPKDAQQSFGGKLTSMVSTLPAQLLAMPFSPADTGMSMIDTGETVEKAQMGSLLSTLGNTVGLAVPGAVGGSLITKVGSGAAINAVQDSLVRKAISDTADQKQTKENFDPTWETAGLAAVLGGGMGALTGGKAKTPTTKPPLTKLSPEWTASSGMSKGEYNEMLRGATRIDDDLRTLNDTISGIEEYMERTGDTNSDLVAALVEHHNNLKILIDSMIKYEGVMSGDISNQITTEQAIARDARKNELIEQLRKERGPRQEATPITEEEQARIDEGISRLDETRPAEEITLDDSTLPKEPMEELHVWSEAALPPEVEVPPITNKVVPTGEQVANLLRGHKTVGEVFATLIKEGVGTRGQKALLAILNRIPHIKSATFSFGQAFQDAQGRWSKGQYDGKAHAVELHKDGNIKTILHEAVHAATHALLIEAKNVHAVALNEIYNSLDISKVAEQYGLTNVHEMVSEALTNPRFKAYLQDIKSTRGPLGKKSISLWTDFKNIIKDALTENKEIRTVLDDVLEHSEGLIETAKRTPEERFQRLSDKQHAAPPVPSMGDAPPVRSLRGAFSRNVFGMNALANFFPKESIVHQAFRQIKDAATDTAKIKNQLLNNTNEVLASGKVHAWNTLSKVMGDSSPARILRNTSKLDMATVHSLFKRGFEEELSYEANWEKNGQHLTPDQLKVYEALSKLFRGMHSAVAGIQQGLGKKHILPYRDGWYPAARVGKYTIEIAYEGTKLRVQTFKTALAAEQFRAKLTDGTNLKHVTVSDVIDASKKEQTQPNVEMAQIIGDTLAQKYPNAAPALQKTIDNLMHSMQTRGGKLGHHHKFRANIEGYKGSELFMDAAEHGDAFREGILASLGDFDTNLRSLIIRSKLEGYVTDKDAQAHNPVEHAAISQLYDSALGRNKEFFEGTQDKASNVLDKGINAIMEKVLGREFKPKQHATTSINQANMGVFAATHMMAKVGFSVFGQILSIPLIMGEMARGSVTGLEAAYSFAKGSTLFWTGNTKLWNHLKEVSQTFDTVEPQFFESLGISRHSDAVTRTQKTLDFVKDYLLLGAVGKTMDGFSRLYAYALAYTHYKGKGLDMDEASYRARNATDNALNTYGTAEAAPILTQLGPVGVGMRPLSSFGINQLGMYVSYLQGALRGETGPLLAMGLTSTLVGGVMSLPFIQEYERVRKLFSKFFDIDMPSVLEVMSRDTSFLSRLNISKEDEMYVKLYGATALSGLNLSTSIKSNETTLSVATAIALGLEDAEKIIPIWGATIQTGQALAHLGIDAAKGVVSAGSKRKAIDSVVSGHWGYGAKELAGVNTTVVDGKNTMMKAMGGKAEADRPRTGADIIGGVLGVKTPEQSYTSERNFQDQETKRIMTERIGKAAALFVEAKPEDKAQYIDKMVNDLHMNETTIINAITRAYGSRLLPADLRFIVTTAGQAKEREVLQRNRWGK